MSSTTATYGDVARVLSSVFIFVQIDTRNRVFDWLVAEKKSYAAAFLSKVLFPSR